MSFATRRRRPGNVCIRIGTPFPVIALLARDFKPPEGLGKTFLDLVLPPGPANRLPELRARPSPSHLNEPVITKTIFFQLNNTKFPDHN
jgi:hypothetical protein